MKKISWSNVYLETFQESSKPFKTEVVKDKAGNDITRKYYKHVGSEGAEVINLNVSIPEIRNLERISHKYVAFGDCPSGATKLGDFNAFVRTDISCKDATLFGMSLLGGVAILRPALDYLAGNHIDPIVPVGMAISTLLAFFYGEDVCEHYFPESATRVETWEQINLCALVPTPTCKVVAECSVI